MCISYYRVLSYTVMQLKCCRVASFNLDIALKLLHFNSNPTIIPHFNLHDKLPVFFITVLVLEFFLLLAGALLKIAVTVARSTKDTTSVKLNFLFLSWVIKKKSL
jgi:hypothetical protein